MSLVSIACLAFLAAPPVPGSAVRGSTVTALEAEYPIRIALHDGEGFLDRALDSEIFARIDAHPGVRAALDGPDAKRGLAALRFLAGALETDLRGMARGLLDETVALYLDPTAPGRSKDDPRLLVIVDLGDETRAARWLDVLDQAAILIGATDEAITEGEVRSINGKEFHAASGRWLIASNERAALEAARAALADPSLRLQRDGTPRLNFEVDVSRLRAKDAESAPKRQENGLGALFSYGLDAASRLATRIEGSLELTSGALTSRVEMLHSPLEANDAAFAWYCTVDGASPPTVRPEGFIASLRLDRDFAAFYRAKESWLAEESENAFVQFDSGMNLFFGGRSFGDEILPALGCGALLVVTSRGYADLPAPPAIKLPAFTLLTGVDEERLAEAELATAFQNTLAIVNLDRAGKGGDSLLAGSSRVGETTLYEARFLPPKKHEGPLDLRFNFSPALALASEHLVIGSAKAGVAAAVAALESAQASRPARAALTEIEIDLAAAGDALAANRDALVDDRMLKEGEDRETAARAIDLFLAVLSGCGELRLALGLESDRHVLDASLSFPGEARR